jgi:enamine deaminase RidA (YjgF/YER057c/UK114 family)
VKRGLFALAAGVTCFAPASAREAANVIMPENPRALEFQNAVGFSDAVIAGDTVYLSGVVAGPAPGDEGFQPGFDRAFKRIENTLKRAGVTWDDVVDITTFHTDIIEHMRDFSTVKNRYVKAPFPTWTAIGISALFEPTAVVEIKVVAKKPRR